MFNAKQFNIKLLTINYFFRLSAMTEKQPPYVTFSEQDAASVFSFFNEIGIIAQLSGQMFEKALPDGLTNAQFGVLNWFTRVDSEATPGRLARAFQVTPGAMTNTLKHLQGKGFVEIRPDANSGRRKLVTMTSKGAAMRERAIQCAAPVFQAFTREFQPEQLAPLTESLEPMRKFLDEARYENGPGQK